MFISPLLSNVAPQKDIVFCEFFSSCYKKFQLFLISQKSFPFPVTIMTHPSLLKEQLSHDLTFSLIFERLKCVMYMHFTITTKMHAYGNNISVQCIYFTSNANIAIADINCRTTFSILSLQIQIINNVKLCLKIQVLFVNLQCSILPQNP